MLGVVIAAVDALEDEEAGELVALLGGRLKPWRVAQVAGFSP